MNYLSKNFVLAIILMRKSITKSFIFNDYKKNTRCKLVFLKTILLTRHSSGHHQSKSITYAFKSNFDYKELCVKNVVF